MADDFNLEMALDFARFAALLPVLFAASRSMLLNSSKPLFFARPVVFRRVPAVLLGAAHFDTPIFRLVVVLGAGRVPSNCSRRLASLSSPRSFCSTARRLLAGWHIFHAVVVGGVRHVAVKNTRAEDTVNDVVLQRAERTEGEGDSGILCVTGHPGGVSQQPPAVLSIRNGLPALER